MKLKDMVAIITGAARGLGFATAKVFFEEGASIVGIDILEPDNKDVATVFGKSDKVFFKKVDITDIESVKNFTDYVNNDIGKVNILVNNAAIDTVGNIEDTTEETFKKIMDVNVFGTFLVTKHIVPIMKKNKDGGSIINVASNIGLVGMADRIAYTTSKGAIINFTRSMALDYAKYNIRVNTISPGAMNTEMVIEFFKEHGSEEFKKQVSAMHALNRFAEPEEIAKAILFLASGDSSYATGSTLVIDGGYTCGK